MFDFGFSELVVIGVVMLIVVGPERLPKVARTAGHLLGRLQRYVSDVKSDIEREMQLEELKKLQQEVKQQALEVETSIRSQAASLETELGRAREEIGSGLPGVATGTEALPQPGFTAAAAPAVQPAADVVRPTTGDRT
jgi:sec-independent protein translocase protein TatB